MSVIIYTYRDPYKLKENKELWKEISSCPYFCAAQTLVKWSESGLWSGFSNRTCYYR